MLEFALATQRVVQLATARDTETVVLNAANGRVCATDIVSGLDLPLFANSAMDGFALRGGALTGSEFDVMQSIAAGDADAATRGSAIEIMTGAKMPTDFTAVIPVENVTIVERTAAGQPARIRVDKDISDNANVRHQGEDVRLGETIVPAGTVLRAPHLMQVAGIGVECIVARQRPQVRIVNTGAELLAPGETPHDSMIHNSNGPYLAQRVIDSGGILHAHHVVKDDPAAFAAAVSDQPREQIIVSTGAVSMGRFDFIPQWLNEQGATIHFHKVAQRPGKPVLFATLNDGRHFFGLPGNPASVAACFRFYVEPMIAAMLGVSPTASVSLPVINDFSKKAPLTQMLKARVEWHDGAMGVRILQGQESFKVQPLLSANAWAVVDAGVTGQVDHAWVYSETSLGSLQVSI